MRGFVLAQLRRGGGRLAAAGIAIALGSAFVAAALLGSTIVKQTAYNAVSASYATADLVVESAAQDITPDHLQQIAAVPGVTAVAGARGVSFQVDSAGRSDWAWGAVAMSDPRLEPTTVTSGHLPGAEDEIALADATAERLRLALGDTVTVSNFAAADSDEPRWEATLVGLLEDPSGFNFDASTAVIHEGLYRQLAVAQADGLYISRALVLLEPGQDARAVRDRLNEAVPELSTMTVDEKAHQTVVEFSGETDVLTAFVLTFAGVALVVAAIVISNTFQVLVAQRARMLALLRCVGATRSQVRRSVLFEASVVGLVSSAVGLALGVLLAQAALWVVPALQPSIPVPGVVTLDAAAVVWPLAAGTLVTVLAALAPARLATRVAPLAALRPLELTPVRQASKVRLVLALAGVLLGGGLLAVSVVTSLATSPSDPTLFVLAGILGGGISVTGVLVGAVYFVPGVARWFGLLAARLGGVPGKVAAANSVRNPRRTTATASALLIGAGLVTMMATGAATARTSLTGLLDDQFPVDMIVASAWDMGESQPRDLTPAQLATVESAEGVRDAVLVQSLDVTVDWHGEEQVEATVLSADPAQVDAVVRTDSAPYPEPGTVNVPVWMEVGDGERVTVSLGGTSLELTQDSTVAGPLRLHPQDFAALGGTPVDRQLWVTLEDGADPTEVTLALRDAFTELSQTSGDPVPEVMGIGAERAGYMEVIDTLLAIVVGLLGVAVIIALVGVANTLSLSVIERRRESATLRAIGLRRGQLRQMLAIEGVIIAVVGAALGAVLGLVYGWAGSTLVLGATGGLRLAVPWRDLAIILVVALAAGLLASVLPARSATRTPPVAALAVD